jgi:5-methylcytosine-specific restriction protein A
VSGLAIIGIPSYMRLNLNFNDSGFDFIKIYGDIAYNKQKEPYIEAHHLIPLSELPEGKSVKYSIENDFKVLCANCHKMVHRRNPPFTIEEIVKIIEKLK